MARTATLRTYRDYFFAQMVAGLLWVGFQLPYKTRLRLLGAIAGRIIAPVVGFRRIIRRNLAMVCPELTPDEISHIARAVPDNATRTLIEIFSGDEFLKVAGRAEIHGAEGLAALEQAHAEGRGVILVSGHFGNYDVPRGVLSRRGFRVGGLYRPMSNRYFNPRYVAAISRISQPVFPRSRRGLGEMVRFLRGGGMVGMLIDQRMKHGAPLTFFGHTAYTALSAAEMALKYDALVVPVYGLRRADGVNFDLLIEPPIEHTTPEQMTQKLNDSLEAHVRRHMTQWLWLHNRWKPVHSRDRKKDRVTT